MNDKIDRAGKILLWAFSISFLVILAITSYIFLVKKDYSFYVEASCDPAFETCFHRDCAEPDSCPPNNLETYKAYEVRAEDFNKCSDNSCVNECAGGTISCQNVYCDSDAGDDCVGQLKF